MIELEICVDSVESAVAAQAGGAQRVELCSALVEGGLTPSAGLIRAVRSRIDIDVFVMIRPRGGDFLYSEEEFAVMQDDIAIAAEHGANGVVFGLLTEEGDIDVERTRDLVKLSRPMGVTFHRAIDMARDPDASLEDVISTGADRVLTSGAAQSAVLGSASIGKLVRAAQNRIHVMVCGGVRPANVSEILRETGASQIHAALRRAVASPVKYQHKALHLGDADIDDYARYAVIAEDVRDLRKAMEAVANEIHQAPAGS
jgi:copper homeostasis protein